MFFHGSFILDSRSQPSPNGLPRHLRTNLVLVQTLEPIFKYFSTPEKLSATLKTLADISEIAERLMFLHSTFLATSLACGLALKATFEKKIPTHRNFRGKKVSNLVTDFTVLLRL